MVANTNTAVRTVTPIVQNKTPLQKSKKGYDPERTEAFIRDVEKRARATGLLPWSFNLVGRLRTRKLIKLKLIEPSGTMNTKGATAFQQNVKKLLRPRSNWPILERELFATQRCSYCDFTGLISTLTKRLIN